MEQIQSLCDVVRIRVDPSFADRRNLAEVELSEGVVEIGDESFRGSSNSIKKSSSPPHSEG
jgi:hypothetical protein